MPVLRFILLVIWLPSAGLSQDIQIRGTDEPVVSVPLDPNRSWPDTSVDLTTAGKVLAVYKLTAGKPSPVPVAGKYRTSGNRLLFEPLYPLGEGLSFQVIYVRGADTVTAEFSIPRCTAPETSPPVITDIFPRADTLPRNVCFFHVRFATPMEANVQAYQKVHIEDPSGKRLENIWRQRSYWLDGQKVLVLMIHPGRLKRGINFEIPFEPGQAYTLIVEPGLKNVQGLPAREPVEKTFVIRADDFDSPEILYEAFRLPKVHTLLPVELQFSEGMDHASIIDGVSITDMQGRPVEGRFRRPINDNRYAFIPTKAWQPGTYEVTFTKVVCDFSNNRLNRLFEIRDLKDIEKDDIPVTWTFTPEE